MSEHRASFEKGNADADPVEFGGRLASCGKKSPSPGNQDIKSERSTAGVRRSSGDGMCAEETRRNTGDPAWRGKKNSTGDPRGGGRTETGVGEVHSSEEARNERGAKEPQFQGNVTSGKRAEIGESLPPPFKLWELQEALHAKAKGNPSYRFYALYDKLCRADVLAEAWRRCLANGGVAGVDGVSFEGIEAYGVSRWLGELAQELRDRVIVPGRFAGCIFRSPMGNKDRWEFPSSGIEWFRWRRF